MPPLQSIDRQESTNTDRIAPIPKEIKMRGSLRRDPVL
jgi:hypothetical protein